MPLGMKFSCARTYSVRQILHTKQFRCTGNCSSKIVHGKLFPPPIASATFVRSLSRIDLQEIGIFRDEVFMVRKTVKNGRSWCSAVIHKKRSAFDMQSHLIVVSILLKTWGKDQGDSSSRLLERRIWLLCIEALLLAVLETFRFTLLTIRE